MAAVIAGAAGALLAQTTETVALDVLSFQRSAELLVMLVLGGAGRLYGGLIGAIVFMVARDRFSGINPQYWYFWIGLLLVTVVMLLPNGLLGGLGRLRGPAGAGGLSVTAALSTRGLGKSFGSLVVAEGIDLTLPRGERYALIGPNGAGKTTLINLMTGVLPPDRGRIFLGDDEITTLAPETRVKRGLVRTFQINTLFPHLTALEAVTLAVCERRGVANVFWRRLPAFRDAIDEASPDPRLAPARATAGAARRASSPTASSGCSRSRSRSPRARRCSCSTSPRPACPGRRARSCST